jgi:hypothetical protein
MEFNTKQSPLSKRLAAAHLIWHIFSKKVNNEDALHLGPTKLNAPSVALH